MGHYLHCTVIEDPAVVPNIPLSYQVLFPSMYKLSNSFSLDFFLVKEAAIYKLFLAGIAGI